jgi:hypothetical protein
MGIASFVRRRAGAGLVFVLGVACSSSSTGPTDPPRACTLIGCQDGLDVDLTPGNNWPAGAYVFTIDADAARVTCRGSLPLPACSAGSAITCDPSGVVSIVESGCALPASAHGFPQIRFDAKARPRKVVVTVTRNDGVIGRAELSPEFQRVEPNGPGCGPICNQARARMTVAF